MKLAVGDSVCISVKSLSESGLRLTYTSVCTDYEEGDAAYWDLYNGASLVCMDGEACKVVEIADGYILLQNQDDTNAVLFKLTWDEVAVCCFT